MYRRLGLSGPEDFSIPLAAWEARKARSNSDVFPRSRLIDQASPVEELHVGISVDSEGQTQIPDLPKDEEKEKGEEIATVHDRLEEVMEVAPLSPRKGGGTGIRGIRPPLLSPPLPILSPQPVGPLTPPPVMQSVVVETTIQSVWDIISSFAPQEGEEGPKKYDDSDEEGETNVGLGGLEFQAGETSEGFTGTSSLSTLNDDDASSSTTETMFTVSPNGKLKRKIKSWHRGQRLGSGSFGTVYEAISE